VDDVLVERPRMQIGPLLRQRQSPDHLGGCDDPADAQAGGEGLREGAQLDHAASGTRDGEQTRQGVPLEAQRPIRVVLDERHAMRRRQRHEALAAFQREGHAGGILEVGHAVEELGLFAQGRFQGGRIEARLVHR